MTSHPSCWPFPTPTPHPLSLLAMHRCNGTFPLVSRSSPSASSIFYVCWPAETSSCRSAWYDATSTTFSVTRPWQRSCYTTPDEQCSHCSSRFSVNAWLLLISSRLNASLVAEIHTNCTLKQLCALKSLWRDQNSCFGHHFLLPRVDNHCRKTGVQLNQTHIYEENTGLGF